MKKNKNLPPEMWRRVKRLRDQATRPELVLKEALRELDVRFKFQWAMRFGVKWYILDFYLPELYICLEADGDSHRDLRAKRYDGLRDRRLRDVGIDTVRIENELLHNVMQATFLVQDGIKKVRGIPA